MSECVGYRSNAFPRFAPLILFRAGWPLVRLGLGGRDDNNAGKPKSGYRRLRHNQLQSRD